MTKRTRLNRGRAWSAHLRELALLASLACPGCNAGVGPDASNGDSIVVSLADSLVAGSGFACEITSGGQAYCWGDNGALGIDGVTRSDTALPVQGGHRFVSLRTLDAHACGIATDSTLYCWGANEAGQIGDSAETWQWVPFPTAGNLAVAEVAPGGFHTCVRTRNGEVYCWGANGAGQLGINSVGSNQPDPLPVAGDLRFSALTAGMVHTCGLDTLGVAYCWGYNYHGEVGDGAASDRAQPVRVATDQRFVEIRAGAFHTCALTRTGDAYCWGENLGMSAGVGDTLPVRVPALVGGGFRFRAVRAGITVTCALTVDGAAYCWGRGSALPVRMSSIAFTRLAVGARPVCAVSSTGITYCWDTDTPFRSVVLEQVRGLP